MSAPTTSALDSMTAKKSYITERAVRSRDAARSHELTLFNAHISKLRWSTMWLLEPLAGHHSIVCPVGAFGPIASRVGHHQVPYAPLVCPEGTLLVMVLFWGRTTFHWQFAGAINTVGNKAAHGR